MAAEFEQATISAEPGQIATSSVRVLNTGQLSAAVRLSLTGEPSAWAWVIPPEVTIPAGAEATVRLCFQVPRSSSAQAGRLPFSLTASSNGESTAIPGMLDVLPFVDIDASIDPSLAEGREETFTVTVDNRGNAPLSTNLEADVAPGTVVDVEPSNLTLHAGAQQRAAVRVRSRRRAVWRVRTSPVSVHVVANGSAVAGVSGTLRQRPTRAPIAAATALILVAAALVWRLAEGEGGRPETAASRLSSMVVAPSMAVGLARETLVDGTRTTPAQGGEPELASRTLVTWIYYPAVGAPGGRMVDDAPPATAQGPFPLILFSHGFGLSGRSASDLISHWAAAGYVVAAPDYPLTSSNAPGGPMRGVDSENQPADASFVITKVLTLAEDPASPFHRMVDPARVAVAGYSMGGGITLAMGFNTCCRDDRVDAAVVLAGNAPVLQGEYFVGPAKPILFVHGDADATVAYSGALQRFRDARPTKLLLTVVGGDHGGPYSGNLRQPPSALVVYATISFFDQQLKGHPESVSKLADIVTSQPTLARLERVHP